MDIYVVMEEDVTGWREALCAFAKLEDALDKAAYLGELAESNPHKPLYSVECLYLHY